MGRSKKNKSKKMVKTTEASSGPSEDDLVQNLENLGIEEPEERGFEDEEKKMILFYMETNKRAELVKKLPKIFGDLDKTVPQRIDLLTLGAKGIRVNHMAFCFQTRSIYRSGQVQVVNGPSDQFGNELNMKMKRNWNKEEGDILIERPNGDPLRGKAPPRPSLTKPMVQFHEKLSRDVITNEAVGMRLPAAFNLTACFRNTISDYLGGPRVHEVRLLTVEIDEGILRLPEGLQLKVKDLSLISGNSNEVLKAIEPIIHESSFPIDSLVVQVENSEDPIFRSKSLAGRFEFVNFALPSGASLNPKWHEAIVKVEHPNIHLSHNELCIKDWMLLVQDWISRPRPVGYKFSMTTRASKELVKQLVLVFGAKTSAVASQCRREISIAVAIPLPNFPRLDLVAYEEVFMTDRNETFAKIVVEVMEKKEVLGI